MTVLDADFDFDRTPAEGDEILLQVSVVVPEREPPDWASLLVETEARVDEEHARANVAEQRRSERDARALVDSLTRQLDDALPGALVAWLAEQVAVPSSSPSGYGLSDATRSSYRRLAIRHPDLRAFVPNLHMETAIRLATRGAFDADDGCRIMVRLTHDMRASRFVLPPVATLERIGNRRTRPRPLNCGPSRQRQPRRDAAGDHGEPAAGRSRAWSVTPGRPAQVAASEKSSPTWTASWTGWSSSGRFRCRRSLARTFIRPGFPGSHGKAGWRRSTGFARRCLECPSWQRGYNRRIALDPFNSRIDSVYGMEAHFVCGRGEDGAPLRSGRRGHDDDGAGPRPAGRTAGYDAPLVRWPCLYAA